MALCTLASLVDGVIPFDYLDEQYAPIDTTQTYDIVAISVMTVNAYRAYDLAKEFRRSGAYIIMGGVHASVVPEEVARYADSVVVGEGEGAWIEFLEDFKKGHPKKIYQGGAIDLDQSPPPLYDFLPNQAFYSPLFQREVFTYQYTRGCPHKCTFCASSIIYGKKYRLKSVDKYIREMCVGLKRSEKHMHFFADDNIFVNHGPCLELLGEIRKLKTVWFGATDITVAEDPVLLKAIRESGCYCLLIGFETLSPENLGTTAPFKAKMVTHYDDYVKRIHDHGINIAASFIVGFDHDSPDTFDRIYDFACRHRIFLCNNAILTPFPGTALYRQLEKEKRLLYKDFWNQCTTMNVLFEPKNMSQEALIEGYHRLIAKESQRGGVERNFFVPENLKQ